MDDDKSITAKLTDAISKATVSVKNAANSLVDKASNAAQHAMEANAEKISRIPPARTDPTQAEEPAIKSANKAAKKPAARETRKAATKPSARASKKVKRKSKKQEF